MAVKKQHLYEPGIYFITFTNYKWLHLFDGTQSYDVVYKWFDWLKRHGHTVTGYVIMPNHLHVLIAYRKSGKSINTIVGNGKRFMAYDIVERLKENGCADTLQILSDGVTASDRKRGKLHEVFEPSFDIKPCRTYEFIQQKLNYIHLNPVSKKWNLVPDYLDYLHSSARFYDTGQPGVYSITHCMEIVDRDWYIDDVGETCSDR
jgi:REP element-mobilizing transposase RayT